MYGLLIENISQYIQERYGVDKWNEIRRLAQIEETSFSTHKVYPDVYTKNIIDKTCQILKLTDKQFLIEVGESFVAFIGRYGYDVVLSALGREFSDFLNSLDDLHEYLRISYPRLRPPSYFCDNENEFGLRLHYRTKRNFLLWYTVGQIIKVAKVFYSTDVEIELLSENQEINEYHFILQLRFDNRVYLERHRNSLSDLQPAPSRLSRLSLTSSLLGSGQCPFGPPGRHAFSVNSIPTRSPSPSLSPPTSSLSANFPTSVSTVSLEVSSPLSPITLEFFLDIFPFSIIYDSTMKICQTGNCLKVVCPNIISQNISKVFSLIKPKIEFAWDSILRHTNATFELQMAILLKSQNKSRRIICELRNYTSTESEFVPSAGYTCHQCHESDETCNKSDDVTVRCSCDSITKDEAAFLKLKGQMIYFDSWKCIAFLGAPYVPSLNTLIKTGLYLNDLSMHDFSRDMVLAGHQQSAELKLALDQELHKSRQLEITIKKLDEERRRSDELLYQMKIADKLRVGEKNIETCQYFPSVTILFSDIINFTEICSKIAPMQVVNMLNETYTRFDQLTEKHNIYKVETIGDAYMVAGGLPVHQEESSYCHARKICQMAMDMIESVYHIKDPSRGRHLKIRIGIHTGPVVGGIVGQKMPRYCLFGDTVNTSSRMETSSVKMKVQISEVTQKLLDLNEWDIRERGTVRLKGKGMMKTYWLSSRKERVRVTEVTNGNGAVDSLSDDRVLPDSTQRALFPLTNHHHNQHHHNHLHYESGIHDSNQSLFVSNRIKMSCLII